MSTAATPTNQRWSRWMNAWTTLSLPGVGVALLAWGPVTVLGTAATVAVPLAMVLFLLSHGQGEWGDESPTKVDSRRLGRVVLCAVTVTTSLAALSVIVAGLAPLLLLLVLVTCPPATDLVRRMLGRGGPSLASPGLVPVEPLIPREASLLAQTARTMTDEELCRAWRRTFWSIKEARSPVEKLSIVDQRQCLLDELEARNAEAVQAWLASGKARACGGLELFFKTDGGDQPTAA